MSIKYYAFHFVYDVIYIYSNFLLKFCHQTNPYGASMPSLFCMCKLFTKTILQTLF